MSVISEIVATTAQHRGYKVTWLLKRIVRNKVKGKRGELAIIEALVEAFREYERIRS